MPSVATFWWTLDDEAEFFSYLETNDPVVAFSAPWKATSQDVIAWDIRELVAEQHPSRLMFGLRRRQDLFPIVGHKFPKSGILFNVEPTSGCLLMYDPVRFRESSLCRCNLAAYWKVLGTNMSKDAEFVSWGKRVFAWVRSKTKGRNGFYGISDRARVGVDQKTLSLEAY